MSNNLIADRRKALEQLERTRAWKEVQSNIAKLFQQRDDKLIDEKTAKKLLAPWYQKRADLLMQFGFSEYAFQARMKKWRSHHNKLVNTQVAQKLASSVWQKFEAYC